MRYREHRDPCDQDVSVTLPDRTTRGVIVNVSAHGARLAGVTGLKVGYRLRIDPGPCCPIRDAEVRWARGDLVGLRFDTPLEPRTIAIIRKSGAHRGLARKAGWNLHLRELR
jgi:hypothetical protein